MKIVKVYKTKSRIKMIQMKISQIKILDTNNFQTNPMIVC